MYQVGPKSGASKFYRGCVYLLFVHHSKERVTHGQALKMLKKELVKSNKITCGTIIKYIGADGQAEDIATQSLVFKPTKRLKMDGIPGFEKVSPKSLSKTDTSSSSEEDPCDPWKPSLFSAQFSESDGTLELSPTCRVKSLKRKA